MFSCAKSFQGDVVANTDKKNSKLTLDLDDEAPPVLNLVRNPFWSSSPQYHRIPIDRSLML